MASTKRQEMMKMSDHITLCSEGPKHPLSNAFKTVNIGTYAEMYMAKVCTKILGLYGKAEKYCEIEDKEDVDGLLQVLYVDAMLGKNIELFTDIYDAVSDAFMDILQGIYIEDAPEGYPIMQEKLIDNMVNDYLLNVLLKGKS